MTLQATAKPSNQFLGPFLGLNTTMDPSQLSSSHATVCNNLILSDGKIRVREPWRKWTTQSETSPLKGKKILSQFSLKLPGLGPFFERFTTLILHVAKDEGPGELWQWTERLDPILLSNQMGARPSQMILYDSRLYVLGGGLSGPKTGINWMTDGTPENTHHIGMRTPVRALNVGAPADYYAVREGAEAANGIGAIVEYAVTLLDDRTGREGNPTLSPIISCNTSQGVQFILMNNNFVIPAHWNENKIRIYRRNHSLGQVGYRLIKEFDYPVRTLFQDDKTESQLDASGSSSSETGPFAPSRNGYKSLNSANMGAIFKSRLFFNDTENDRILRFSAIGRPHAVDPDDFFTLDGDPDETLQGIATLGDFLIVGKRRAMWSLSGNTNTPTNIDNATGVKGLEDNTILQRIPTKVGPYLTANIGGSGLPNNGNGFFAGGQPARLYFPNDAGFFMFDGISVESLTGLIKPTWDTFYFRSDLQFQGQMNPAPNFSQHFTFCDDPNNGIIYICNHGAGFGLAYHYRLSRSGVPVWSTIDGGSIFENGKLVVPSVFATQSGVPHFKGLNRPSTVSLLVGDTQGRVWEADRNDVNARVANFEWASGDMPAIRGLEAHLYFVRIFTTTQMEPLQGDQTNPLMTFSIIPDADPGRQTRLTRPVNNTNRVIIPVRRKMSRLQIKISKSPVWRFGWSEKYGILGWDFDTELVGQR